MLGSSDVVKNGEPTHSFMVGIQHIGTEHSDEHLHLSGNQSDWKVFLRNSNLDSQSPEAALRIGRITLTVEHPETVVALEPRIRAKSTLGWSVESNSGYALAPESSLEVSFHFACKKIGESRILITLPILQYETVEFGIAKRCTHVGRVRKSSQLVFTAGKAFASLVAICVAGVVIIVRRRSSAQKGFEALPTTDR
ncbi:hypothetical protein FGB62_22g333 [Gracilaria domingensis]|nr:hypothetical protein FGB62_22g333 [Gracilaria domingensis]